MATNEDYRDFVYMNQQRNIMNKLNDMGAPSVSTIINVIEKVGGRYQQQANIILENAVRSKDPVIMSEAKEQILA